MRKYGLFFLFILFFVVSCSTSDNTSEEVKITAEDLVIEIDENPSTGQILGNVNASTNSGNLSFVLISSNPPGAISIDSSNGNISVNTSELFEYDDYPQINATIGIINGAVEEEISVTISLNEVIETIAIDVEDFLVDIDENPSEAIVLGNVIFSTNGESPKFSITDLSVDGAITVDEVTGEVKIDNTNLFDFEAYHQITAVVTVQIEDVSSSANILIEINDLKDTSISFSEVTVQGSIFSGRTNMASLAFHDNLLVLGGWDGTGKNDVWSTSNGVNWEEIGEFGGRGLDGSVTSGFGVNVVEFNDKLWLFSIATGLEFPAQIWTSDDGVLWNRINPQGEFFNIISGMKVVVFQNKLWVIGGQTDNNSGIWSSSDGINWDNIETIDTSFSELRGHSLVVFKNKLYVIAGKKNSEAANNRVWVSSDGLNWIEEISGKPKFEERSYQQTVVLNNKIWLIGGIGNDYFNDVWSSSNGIDWIKEDIIGDHFSQRGYHSVSVFDSKIWVLGGRYLNQPRLNDVWVMD